MANQPKETSKFSWLIPQYAVEERKEQESFDNTGGQRRNVRLRKDGFHLD